MSFISRIYFVLLLVIIFSSYTSSKRERSVQRPVRTNFYSRVIPSHPIMHTYDNWKWSKSPSRIHPVQIRDRSVDRTEKQFNLCNARMSDGRTCIYFKCDVAVKDTHSGCINSISKNYTRDSNIGLRSCNYTAYLVEKCITSSSSTKLFLTNTFLLLFVTFIYCKTIYI